MSKYHEQLSELDQALALLILTEKVVAKRRAIEQACGYPEEYGGDGQLLVVIQQYLRMRVADCARLMPILDRLQTKGSVAGRVC